jgi:hypothetical protein
MKFIILLALCITFAAAASIFSSDLSDSESVEMTMNEAENEILNPKKEPKPVKSGNLPAKKQEPERPDREITLHSNRV